MAEIQQLETMEKYIHNTKLPDKKRYDMTYCEMDAIWQFFKRDINFWEVVRITFNFGMAKGYRMALAEIKKGVV